MQSFTRFHKLIFARFCYCKNHGFLQGFAMGSLLLVWLRWFSLSWQVYNLKSFFCLLHYIMMVYARTQNMESRKNMVEVSLKAQALRDPSLHCWSVAQGHQYGSCRSKAKKGFNSFWPFRSANLDSDCGLHLEKRHPAKSRLILGYPGITRHATYPRISLYKSG